MPSSAGDGVSAVSAQPKERSRNVVARAAAFRLLGAYVQGWTVLARILHEGSGICTVAGNTVWSIVQISIAIAMVFEGSAEM